MIPAGADGYRGRHTDAGRAAARRTADAEDDRLHDRSRRHHGLEGAQRRARHRPGDEGAGAPRRQADRLPAEPRRRAPAHRAHQRHQSYPVGRERGARHDLAPRLRHLGISRGLALPPDRDALRRAPRSARPGALHRRHRLGGRGDLLADGAAGSAGKVLARKGISVRDARADGDGNRSSLSSTSTTSATASSRSSGWWHGGGGGWRWSSRRSTSPMRGT